MTNNDFFFMQQMLKKRGGRYAYPRVIDLVQAIRSDGGIPNDERYKNGDHQYNNIVRYIETKYRVDRRMSMDAAKYFLR